MNPIDSWKNSLDQLQGVIQKSEKDLTEEKLRVKRVAQEYVMVREKLELKIKELTQNQSLLNEALQKENGKNSELVQTIESLTHQVQELESKAKLFSLENQRFRAQWHEVIANDQEAKAIINKFSKFKASYQKLLQERTQLLEKITSLTSLLQTQSAHTESLKQQVEHLKEGTQKEIKDIKKSFPKEHQEAQRELTRLRQEREELNTREEALKNRLGEALNLVTDRERNIELLRLAQLQNERRFEEMRSQLSRQLLSEKMRLQEEIQCLEVELKNAKNPVVSIRLLKEDELDFSGSAVTPPIFRPKSM